MDQGDLVFGIEGILPNGITFIGGLPGQGKTWFALSIVRALVTGEKFLGNFNVSEPVPVIYMTPEVGDRAFRKRLEIMRISDERFFCRTITAGEPLKLDDPRLLAAIRELRPYVVLDTAIRFSDAESENSATENAQGLARNCIEIMQVGASGVIGIHHATKNLAKEEMALENVLRGTGDLAAMCDAVYGVRRINATTLELKVECVKARDFEPIQSFHVRGRPYLNDVGDLRLLEPDEHGSRKDQLSSAIEANPRVTYRQLSKLTGIPPSHIKKEAARAGWEKIKEQWTREQQLELANQF